MHKPNALFWLACGGLAAIAFVCLWQEHRLHLMGALPYLLILLCPLMHLFMHHGHGDGHGGHDHGMGGHGHHDHSSGEEADPPREKEESHE